MKYLVIAEKPSVSKSICLLYTSKAYPLNGVERLQIMYETFHQEEQQKFDFSYDRILQSGMTTKDFIAPTSFLFKSGKDFMLSLIHI